MELLDDGLTGWRLTCGAAASAPGGGVLGYGAFWGLQLTHPLATESPSTPRSSSRSPRPTQREWPARIWAALSAELNQVPANWAIVATDCSGALLTALRSEVVGDAWTTQRPGGPVPRSGDAAPRRIELTVRPAALRRTCFGTASGSSAAG